MHILHISLGGCLRPPPVRYGLTEDTGGHIAYVLGAATAQATASGTRVTIVTRAFDDELLGAEHGLARQRLDGGTTIRRLRTDKAGYLSKAALSDELPALSAAFLALVAQDRPDVIHAHFADAAELALNAAAIFDIPVLYTPHSLALQHSARRDTGSGAEPSGELARRLARETRAIREADAIVVSSGEEAREQVGAYDRSAIGRTLVARPGITAQAPAPAADAEALIDPFFDDPERSLLLAIARPVGKKNLVALLDAYASDDWLRTHANLAIVAGQHASIRAEGGEQALELERLERGIVRHGLQGSVALPPAHGSDTVAALYRLAADRGGLFVNPACHEPFGLTLIEAAQAGLPVVATCQGGPSDIVNTLGHGWLIDPEQPDALAATLRAALQDRTGYTRARQAALRHHGRYTWTGWAAAVDRVIARCRHERDRARTVAAPSAARSVRSRVRSTGRSITACAVPRMRVGRATHFLAFDIDDTLTGSRDGVQRFRRWFRGRCSTSLPLAVATGRELPEARAVIERWGLPEPDVWITSVGTEIYRRDARGTLIPCAAHAHHLAAGWDRDAIIDSLADSGLPFQAPRTQRPFKVSLFGTADDATSVRRRLERDGHDLRVVASHGRFIDVLPRAGGKAEAIEFEAARRDVGLSACVAAGNSGNDADMLERCGKAILVGNALPEIAHLGDRPGLYRAAASHVDGVLEGLVAHAVIELAGGRATRRTVAS